MQIHLLSARGQDTGNKLNAYMSSLTKYPHSIPYEAPLLWHERDGGVSGVTRPLHSACST